MKSNRPSGRDAFEIAIICALPLERDAVEALLDEDYEECGASYGKALGDKNAYTIGRLGRQHVVIAHMPGMGTISAAAVAANLISSFDRIQVAFVVGICGGVPVSSNPDGIEIRLGDVIVSTSIVQIDFGRQYPDGFHRKQGVEEILGRAGPGIRAFVGKLSGQRSRERLEEKIFSLSGQLSLQKKSSSAAYPGPQHDTLYAANHRHRHWNSNCKICDECESNTDKVCRSALDSNCELLGCQGVSMPEARQPAVHFGRIACGSQVIKSALHRDQIAAQEQVIGFEMESAGTWDCVPTIVVKGVCDYADSHKSKRWQRYAAFTAAACTKAILDQWRGTDRGLGLPPQPTFPVHTTVTRPVNTLFTGRSDLLSELESIVRGTVEDQNQQEPCHIVLSGMGGQGKSEICLRLAHQLRNLFWGTFWVDVSTATLAENGFLDIAGRLGVTVPTLEAARQELANAKQPWLLVLDNADDPDFDYQPYVLSSPFGVVIMTSRNAECERYATRKWINLEGLSHVDARDLLLSAAHAPDAHRESFQADAQNIVQLLQSHPLALIQAGSYVNRGHCSLKNYLQVYHQQRKRLLKFRPVQAGSRYQDVYATFEISAETLQRSATESASDALELLSILATYGPSRLPVVLFEAAWTGAQSGITDEVANSDLEPLTTWHLARLPAFLQIEAEAWDSFRLVEALNLLKAFSIISVDTEASCLSVSMHPLVHAWARDRLSTEQRHVCWVQAGCIVALTYYQRELWLRHARQLQSHLQAVVSWSMSTMFGTGPTMKICSILVDCGWFLRDIRDDATLLRLTDSLCVHLKLDPSIVTLQWLSLYDLIASSSSNSGLTKHALMLLEQVVKIEEQTLLEDHPDRLASLFELATVYRANGQLQDALRMIEQVVRIREQTLAEDHSERLASLHELAIVYRDNGQLQDALRVLEQTLKIKERMLPDDHPSRLASLHELAIVYRDNGQLQDALRVIEQVVRIQEQTLAEGHPVRLASLHELAMVYRANGQLQDALKVIEQVVEIKKQTLAEDHPERLTSEQSHAICLWETGDEKTAIDTIRRVVRIRRQLQPEGHPDRILSEDWLGYFETEAKERLLLGNNDDDDGGGGGGGGDGDAGDEDDNLED